MGKNDRDFAYIPKDVLTGFRIRSSGGHNMPKVGQVRTVDKPSPKEQWLENGYI